MHPPKLKWEKTPIAPPPKMWGKGTLPLKTPQNWREARTSFVEKWRMLLSTSKRVRKGIPCQVLRVGGGIVLVSRTQYGRKGQINE